jgi:PKD repeat protein
VAYDSGTSETFVSNAYDCKVSVISDSSDLAAASVSSSPGVVVQGQIANLSSTVTTGAAPYMYQWFSEAPNATSYSPIGNATSSSFSFATSASTAAGNWTFMLQVTDATGAAVNSTAVMVTVNDPPQSSTAPTFSPAVVILLVIVIAAVVICAAALAFKKFRRANSVSKQMAN